MAQEQPRKLSAHKLGAVHFDDRTALHLTQAFNQEESLAGVLKLLHAQMNALTGAYGLHFAHTELQVDISLGKPSLHTAEYNLSLEDSPLGTLTLRFPRRQNEQEVQTCEDLISLAFTALKNNVEKLALTQSGNKSPDPLAAEEKADALILVALDGYAEMRLRDGDEWSQVLMSSVHTQIKEGLRQADGVYQISDEQIAVLLPHTTSEQALEVAHKIRVLVASLHLTGGSEVNRQLTASMGISDAKLAHTAEEVMANAKTALVAAKDQGHNVIQAYDEALLTKLGVRAEGS